MSEKTSVLVFTAGIPCKRKAVKISVTVGTPEHIESLAHMVKMGAVSLGKIYQRFGADIQSAVYNHYRQAESVPGTWQRRVR